LALRRARSLPPSRRKEAEDRVIQETMPLARSLARRYAGRGLAAEDLEQVAFLGLIKAVHGFDPGHGSDFVSYAVPTIRGELQRHFRDVGWTVRPPRRIQELQSRLWAAQADLAQSLHRAPTPIELADALDAPVEDVTEALTAGGCFTPSSLDAPAPDSDTGSIGERLVFEEQGFAHSEARMMLASALRNLGARDRRIVAMRFFDGRTQQEIGEEVGVTQMQISRLLSRILNEMRSSLTAQAA
jgi:RNA polymerase sigma-B factor